MAEVEAAAAPQDAGVGAAGAGAACRRVAAVA